MSYGRVKHYRSKMRRAGSSRRSRLIPVQIRVERIAMQWKGAATPKFSATACIGGAQRGGYARDPLRFGGSRRCVWHVAGSTPTRAVKKALSQLARMLR